MANLVEAYKKRLAISESVYARNHDNAKMSSNTKLATAKCLQNVEKFINEAFENSAGTQRSDLGLFKKFCLNLTTVALPNLIANDLVIVSPMSSMTGYVAYVRYTTDADKGASQHNAPNGPDTHFQNDPFHIGDVDANYTGDRVVENLTTGTGNVVAWTPVVKGTIEIEGKKYDARVTKDNGEVQGLYIKPEDNKLYTTFDGESYTTEYNATGSKEKLAYVYDNVVVPQKQLPTVRAEMDSIPLLAHARRVAVYYSQIAAYQAKTDYGFDLGDQLAEKAVGQLSYEIDTEVVQLLSDYAKPDAQLQWSKTLPVGVSKKEHYEGFAEMVEIGRQKIYDLTRRFAPNYMLIASDVLPVLNFISGFTPAPAGQINGPYFAGTLNSLKVYVSPAIEAGEYVLGVNGSDLMSSAAVYAPYMAIVPTQLLQYADGGTTQGWSTLYDLKPLNTYDDPTAVHGQFSRLLVKGKITV